jgi:hypothetical protein
MFVAMAVVAVVPTLVVAAQLAAPTAGPEHKRVHYFVGTWNFNGTVKDSPMGKGGPMTMKETCELMDGGFAVVCRGEGKGPMGPQKTVSIMSYDAEKKTYTFTAAESGMPVFTALGQVKGPTWTWTMQSSGMTTRVTITEKDPRAYDFVMEMSMDGKTFARLAEAKVTKG